MDPKGSTAVPSLGTAGLRHRGPFVSQRPTVPRLRNEVLWRRNEVLWRRNEVLWRRNELLWRRSEVHWLRNELLWRRSEVLWLRNELLWLRNELLWLRNELLWLRSEVLWLRIAFLWLRIAFLWLRVAFPPLRMCAPVQECSFGFAMGTAGTFQMPSEYSRIDRSLLNVPIPATLRTADRVHVSGAAHARETLSWQST
jgi:hypothetical protein